MNFSIMFPARLRCMHECGVNTHVGKGFASVTQGLLRLLHSDVIVPCCEVRHAYEVSEIGVSGGNSG